MSFFRYEVDLLHEGIFFQSHVVVGIVTVALIERALQAKYCHGHPPFCFFILYRSQTQALDFCFKKAFTNTYNNHLADT